MTKGLQGSKPSNDESKQPDSLDETRVFTCRPAM